MGVSSTALAVASGAFWGTFFSIPLSGLWYILDPLFSAIAARDLPRIGNEALLLVLRPVRWIVGAVGSLTWWGVSSVVQRLGGPEILDVMNPYQLPYTVHGLALSLRSHWGRHQPVAILDPGAGPPRSTTTTATTGHGPSPGTHYSRPTSSSTWIDPCDEPLGLSYQDAVLCSMSGTVAVLLLGFMILLGLALALSSARRLLVSRRWDSQRVQTWLGLAGGLRFLDREAMTQAAQSVSDVVIETV